MPSKKLLKVAKSNDLNSANFSEFNLSLYKVFLNIITKIERYDKNGNILPTESIVRNYSLSASDYAAEFNISKRSSYSILKAAASKLMRTPLSLPKTRKGEEEGLLEVSICSQAFYVKNSGRIDIEFSEKIMPHLTEIQERFTLYNLCEISGFESMYTARFYELLMQYKTTGILKISVDELRHALGCAKIHMLYADFKRSAFGHAVKEINSQYEMSIKFKEIKESKAVDRLEFYFKKTLKDQVYDLVTKKVRSQLTRPKKKKIESKEILSTVSAREAFSELANKLRVKEK